MKFSISLQRVDSSISSPILQLEISECSSLSVEFTKNQIKIKASEDQELLEVQEETKIDFLDIQELVLRGLPGSNITFENVTRIETHFATTNYIDFLGITHEQLYFYLVLALASCLLLCVLVVIPIIIFSTKTE